MEISALGIDGAWLVTSPVWGDERGSFREWFKSAELLAATGINFVVSQANVSLSNRGVIRGIHYSLVEEGQAKWVTCVNGAIIDVIVDIRSGSPTYGKHVTIDLKGGDGRSVFVDRGLGHGFISLENGTAVSYLLSSPYSPRDEFEIYPLDPMIGIDWKLSLLDGAKVSLSPKDSGAPSLAERASQGKLPK